MANKKKSFTGDIAAANLNPALNFISGTAAGGGTATQQNQDQAAAGQARETRTKRIQLLTTKSLYDRIYKIAWDNHDSVNNTINLLLEDALEQMGKEQSKEG